jgi:hypothetical protein
VNALSGTSALNIPTECRSGSGQQSPVLRPPIEIIRLIGTYSKFLSFSTEFSAFSLAHASNARAADRSNCEHCNQHPHLQRKPELSGHGLCNEHCIERSHQ